MSERRVVVTGMGLVSSLGNDIKTFWNNLLNGISNVDKFKKFDADSYGLPTNFGGEVCPIEGDEFFTDKKMLRRFDPFITYAVYSAYHAMKQAGIKSREGFDSERAGVIVGSGIGGMTTIMREHNILNTDGARRVSPFFIPMQIANMASGMIAIEHGFQGVNYAPVTACATATHAIGLGLNHIRNNEADIMIVGGSESVINPLAVAGFSNAQALSKRVDNPKAASRPFDKDRDGFVISEGAGVLILEEEEHAKKRGAVILAELSGYGFTCDANHITAPLEDGAQSGRSMKLALASAKISPDKVDYINTHGTSTPVGDIAEVVAIKNSLGEHAKKVKINSTKSMTGHALGAAGGLEAIVTIMSILENKLHPTINVDNQDPACDLDCVPNTAEDYKVNVAMSNSFGFGGHNASIVFKRYS